MVSSRNEGGAPVLSASVRKTIQSVKEVVGNHSDADIYVALKECNMDPHETIQKLLLQDPFHEVKRKRDKKKENSDSIAAVEHKINSVPVRVPEKQISYPDRSSRKGGYNRKDTSDSGAVREFRVVRDYRMNQNTAPDMNSDQSSTLMRERVNSNLPLKSNSTRTNGNNKVPMENQLPQTPDEQADSLLRQGSVLTSSTGKKKVLPEEKQPPMPNVSTAMQTKANDDLQNFTSSSNSYVVGVYSSSSDPVHVPSRHSRPSVGVGAIRREVGVVGTRRQSFENSVKPLSSNTLSNTNASSWRDSHSKESTRPVNNISKSEQFNLKTAPDSAPPLLSVSKSNLSNHHGLHSGRAHQLTGYQKAPQTSKEWKPKSSLKSSATDSVMPGSDVNTVSPQVDKSDGLIKGEVQMEDKISGLNISDKQNVILAAHIRVTESDRHRLTFGSLGIDLDSSANSIVVLDEGAVKSSTETSGSIPALLPESTENEHAGAKLLGLIDEPVQSSVSNSPSGVAPDHLIQNTEHPNAQNLDKSADVGLLQGDNQSYPPESLHQQDASEIPSFSNYDSQTGYEMSYFRPMVEDAVRGPDLPPEEVSGSHMVNNIPTSTIAMVQQQQLAQMYPSMHVSHFANLMPYRQFVSPIYVPPVPMPGYSNSPAYTHPSSGSSYLLMPGNSTHLSQSGLKYGVQQFKPVPTGNRNGFGNFPSPTGYAINTPGVGNAGFEDSSGLKFKDSLYVPNPQADTNEIWMNPRDLPNLQSASYYNLPAHTTHAAYLSSHSGHASSSHLQFPGMYHPPAQPVAIASHHLGPSIGGNAPVPGAQVGSYQQPQLGHLNWNGNF